MTSIYAQNLYKTKTYSNLAYYLDEKSREGIRRERTRGAAVDVEFFFYFYPPVDVELGMSPCKYILGFQGGDRITPKSYMIPKFLKIINKSPSGFRNNLQISDPFGTGIGSDTDSSNEIDITNLFWMTFSFCCRFHCF